VKENPRINFLAMVRNPLDVSLSFISFFKQFSQTSKEANGGFPPPMFESDNFTEEADRILDFVHNKMRNNEPSGTMFRYIKGWWSHRHDPNVLLLHYGDAIKDLADTVSKLATFLDVPLTEDEHMEITRRCGIDNMKLLGQEGRFAYRMPLNRRFGEFTLMKVTERDGKKEHGLMIDKGGSRGAKMFTKEQQKFVRQIQQQELGHDPDMLEWANNGGQFPL
jgi:hypothetical protein